MTIRTVHLLFITVSVLLAVFVGAWALGRYGDEGSTAYLAAAVAALAAAAGLVVYGVRFRRRSRYW